MEKRCINCGEVKSLSLFYAHKGMADGHLNKCKECCKTASTENRNKNIEYYRMYDMQRGNRQDAEYYRKWREENPEKYKAHITVNNAVRDGKLIPKDCERCGKPNTHAHHDDYSKPLDVKWLCPPCHAQRHKELDNDNTF